LIENLPLMIDAALKLVLGLVEGIIAAIPVLIEAIPTLIESMVDAIIEALPMIITAAYEIIEALVFGILENIPLILSALFEMVATIGKKLASPEFKEKWAEMGKEMVDGMKEGFLQRWEDFKTKIVENFKQMVQWIKNLLGIASPSKVFAGIGDNLMAGLAVGIDRSSGLPAMASSQAMNRVSNSTINNTYNLTGQYQYQSQTTLMDQVRLLSLMGGA